MKLKAVLFIVLTCSMLVQNVHAREFTEKQQKIADELTEVCIDNWKQYGVLPSTCIAQAFVESTLGEHCSGYNLWGIRSGAEKYNSLEDGTLRYLKVINNGYYDKAPFETDYKKQIKAILDGGYCQPVGDYCSNAMWAIESYDLLKYNEKLFDELERKERKKQQDRKFRVIHDDSIPKGVVLVDKNIIPSGAVCIYINGKLYNIYDVASGGQDNVIRINNKMIDRFRVNIEVYENAKG